jgi:hypothetical protein
MPRRSLLGSIILSVASLTFAQANPPNTDSTQTAVVTQVPGGTRLADASGSPNSVSDSDATSAQSLPLANAIAVSTPPVISTLSAKDQRFSFDRRPRLVLMPLFNLNGAGFGNSVSVSAGVGFDSRKLILESLGSYNAARKTNDGTGNNPKGHIRSLNASAYYRLPNYWFLGTSGGWDQLSTTNYTKQSWGMRFGGGSDFIVKDTSFRLIGTYTPATFDHSNGIQGPSIQLMLPSPLAQGHVMFVENLDIMFLHDTITDPNDKVLTEQQKAHRSHTATLSLGLVFRF